MLTKKFAGFVVTGLLLGTGLARAAGPTFPSAGMESGEYSLYSKAAQQGIAKDGKSAFPSTAREGYEFTAENFMPAAPRNLDRMQGHTATSLFPSAGRE